MQSRSSGRGLSTARAALQIVWLLAARPEGVRADLVAERLGKSVSTAYNLLASLCEEGVAVHHSGGVYRLAAPFRELVTTGTAGRAPELRDLSGVAADLLARTHKRAYVGVLRGGELHVVLERGQQGMPRLPGLRARVGRNAHALALGKVVLALAPAEVVERYGRPGLRAFTDRTITDPHALVDELRAVRRDGFAVDREEFRPDFCSIAAPVVDRGGRFVAAIGISMSRRAFEDEGPHLARTVLAVAAGAGREVAGPARPLASEGPRKPAFQRSSETPAVLDPGVATNLACANGSTLP